MKTVNDLLESKSRELWTIEPQATVFAALKLMADRDIGALPVVSEGRLVGIVSERDYARRGILQGRASKDTPVSEIMTTSLHSTTPDETLERCMLLMLNKHVRHLPVLDAGGQLTGIISAGDVLKAIIEDQREHIVRLELDNAPAAANGQTDND